jgi:hypothetical protein
MAQDITGPPPAAARDLRELSRGIAEAPDAQVTRVVAVVDQLPERGGADALIAPLRPRLAKLRPRRPLRFARLLFLPLEPLLVPPLRWQPHLPRIPRSVLPSLAATVRTGLGHEAGRIDTLIRQASAYESAAVAAAGALLWPRAAAWLTTAPPPVNWAETALSPSVYPALAGRVGVLLAQVTMLQELVAEADAGISPPRLPPLRAMLADVQARCPDALPMLLTLLLARLPAVADRLEALVSELGSHGEDMLREAGHTAAEALLAGLEAGDTGEIGIASDDLADAAQQVRRSVALLTQLAARNDLPGLRTRVMAVRQRLDAGCRARFARALEVDFLTPLRRLLERPDAAAAATLEATARHLRELETEARSIGGAEQYDTHLRAAAATVSGQSGGLDRPARARLVEILVGTEPALRLLRADC